MLRPTQVALGLVLAVLLWLFFKPQHAPSPTPTPSPSPVGKAAYSQRLVAIGDLHGDIDNAKTVLKLTGLIDPSDSWIGGKTILVQTGDIVDRGTYALDIYRLMASLRTQAHNAGGKVISILGNHEMMNALSDWRYVSQPDIKHWGGLDKRRNDMSVSGWLGQEWLANYTVSEKVSMSPYTNTSYSFTHGSLRPTFPHLLPYPQKINDLGRDLLERALSPPLGPPHPPYPYEGLPKGAEQAELELYGSGGPLWWRGLAQGEERTVCAWAEELKSKLGVRRVIGGHTPDFDKIVHRCDGSVIIIDTGISSAYGGVLSALEIIYTLTPVNGELSGKLKGTYLEREEVYAVYLRRKERIALVEKQVVVA